MSRIVESRHRQPTDEPRWCGTDEQEQEQRTVVASVVTCVRGNTTDLPGLVACLADQRFPQERIELIVVDNHRRAVVTSDTLTHVGGLAVTVLHDPVAGVSRARNSGIRRARGDYVLFTDPDSRPEPDWVAAMVRALDETGAHCAGGRVVPYFTSTRRLVDPELEQMFVPPAWPRQRTPLRARYWLAGCNLAVRRDTDPRFCEQLGVRGRHHRTCEDLEFVIRSTSSGRDVVVVPEGVVHRAVHARDLHPLALAHRAFGHGWSMARVVPLHPTVQALDDYHLSAAVHHVKAGRWTAGLVAFARVAGWWLHHLQHPFFNRSAADARTS